MKRKGWPEQMARAIEEAVDRTLAARVITTDLGGNAKTVDVTQAVLQYIEDKSKGWVSSVHLS